jgi:hypothetical protein
MDPNNQHYRSGQSSIKICEAVDCYEAATEAIVVSAGKFGTICLSLCYKCMVTRFRTLRSQNTILKKNRYTGQKIPLNQPVEDCGD